MILMHLQYQPPPMHIIFFFWESGDLTYIISVWVSCYWLRGKDDFLLEAKMRQVGISLNRVYLWLGQVNRKSRPVYVNQYDSEGIRSKPFVIS